MESRFPCQVSKERILKSYDQEIARMGEDSDRSHLRLSKELILQREPQELWKLWVLANLYQRVSEKASQARFIELLESDDDQIIFSPNEIDLAVRTGTCPLLDSDLTIHSCDYNNRRDACNYPTHKDGCIVKVLSQILARHPSYSRIAKTIVCSAAFLSAYDYNLDRLYTVMKEKGEEANLIEVLRAISGLKQGQKIPSMFLAWLSNPSVYGIWELDYAEYIPIDVNVRRVARRALGCTNDEQVKVSLQELSSRFDLNVRTVELSFLNVGQMYCHKATPSCLLCPFGCSSKVKSEHPVEE
jgi:hypothetical protein